MNSIKNFIFVLTLIFSVLNIKCEENEDLFVIFTQEITAKECYQKSHLKTVICDEQQNPWGISEFLHQLPNDPSLKCLNSIKGFNPVTVPISIQYELKKNWKSVDDYTYPALSTELIWGRFGGCTSEINEISNATKYYDKSSELYKKYNLSNILSEANITPGKNYTAQQISDAVSSAIGGKKVLLRCAPISGTDDIEFEAITIYLDKSFKPIDAVKNNGLHTNPYVCPRDKLIRYDFRGEHLNIIFTHERKVYEDPTIKYPTLSKDDNGYYILEQALDNFDCYEVDVSKCALPKYPWYIFSFTYKFNDDIKFDCEGKRDNFDPKNISSIQNELLEKWNHKIDDFAEDFGFQWSIGARCSAYFKGLDSPFKYYKKSIELFDKYNMNVILRESNIIPGNNYTRQAIADAVSKSLKGTTAKIICSAGAFGAYNLQSIQIYFDQSFNLINNPRESYLWDHECQVDRMIRYKDFTPEI
ncbi:uncharacterized protein LOC130674633 [Microplitis mediator]|uniref:uncharacterized protein LOC130674633 n=1 Tax=Microplitis mediator TaxID=375433 RepID=UPI002556CC15|nr:uncharacterized protein LOC130674633 [Microplitis mediator]